MTVIAAWEGQRWNQLKPLARKASLTTVAALLCLALALVWLTWLRRVLASVLHTGPWHVMSYRVSFATPAYAKANCLGACFVSASGCLPLLSLTCVSPSAPTCVHPSIVFFLAGASPPDGTLQNMCSALVPHPFPLQLKCHGEALRNHNLGRLLFNVMPIVGSNLPLRIITLAIRLSMLGDSGAAVGRVNAKDKRG